MMLHLLNLIALLGAGPCDAPAEIRIGGELALNVYILELVSCEPRENYEACLREMDASQGTVEQACRATTGAQPGEAPFTSCASEADVSRKRECMPTCKMRVQEVVSGREVTALNVMQCHGAADPDKSKYLYLTDHAHEDEDVVELPWCLGFDGQLILARMPAQETFVAQDEKRNPGDFAFRVEYRRALAKARSGICLADLMRWIASGTPAEREAAVVMSYYAKDLDTVVQKRWAAMVEAPAIAFSGKYFARTYRATVHALLGGDPGNRRGVPSELTAAVQHLVGALRATCEAPESETARQNICGNLLAVHNANVPGLDDLVPVLNDCP